MSIASSTPSPWINRAPEKTKNDQFQVYLNSDYYMEFEHELSNDPSHLSIYDETKTEIRDNYKLLLVAVCELAFDDFFGVISSHSLGNKVRMKRTTTKQDIQKEARKWLFGRNSNFVFICSQLGWDIKWIRRKLFQRRHEWKANVTLSSSYHSRGKLRKEKSRWNRRYERLRNKKGIRKV